MVSIHVKNLQLIMTEIYKAKSGLSPPFMKDIFAERNNGYNLRHGNDSQLLNVHTATYGIETISFLCNRLWSTLPNIFKQASTLPIFKNHIKCWKGDGCNRSVSYSTRESGSSDILRIFIHEVRLSGVRASITIVHIRKFYKT